VLLIPDYITLDGLIPNATNNTVCVGQQMNLTNMISGVSTNAITNWKWSIPGANGNTNTDTAIYEYEPTAQNSNYTNLVTPTNYLTNASGIPFCNFYFTAPGTNQVSCTTVIYGQTNTVSATFNVSRPHAVITASQGTIRAGFDPDYSDYLGYLHFGDPPTNYPPSPTPGMYFTQTNTPATGGFTGMFSWVQVLTNAAITRSPPLTNNTISVSPGYDDGGGSGVFPEPLDTNDPVGTSDSPGANLPTDKNYCHQVFNATMYLMWKASTNSVNGDKTIMVPLRAFQWDWNATASNASPTTNDGTGWGIQSANYPTNTTDVDITNEPSWTTNAIYGSPH
jgi:hypothetical protein